MVSVTSSRRDTIESDNSSPRDRVDSNWTDLWANNRLPRVLSQLESHLAEQAPLQLRILQRLDELDRLQRSSPRRVNHQGSLDSPAPSDDFRSSSPVQDGVSSEIGSFRGSDRRGSRASRSSRGTLSFTSKDAVDATKPNNGSASTLVTMRRSQTGESTATALAPSVAPDVEDKDQEYIPRLGLVRRRQAVRGVVMSRLGRTKTGGTLDTEMFGAAEKSGLGRRNPASPAAIGLKILGLVLLATDMMVIPFKLAFEVENVWFTVLSWISASFWTLELCSQFWLGYFLDGKLITNQRKIAFRYFRSWFPLDVTVLTIDWVTLHLDGQSSTATMRIFRLMKVGKLFRALAVLRALRYMHVLQEIIDYYSTDSALAAMRLGRILAISAWMTHALACVWYAVGRYGETDTGNRWLDVYFNGGAGSLEAEYVLSFHWAMSIATLGSVDVICTNSMERAFNIFSLTLGLAGSSMLVSILSAAMVESHMAVAQRDQKLRTLRKFLRQNSVNTKLIHAVLEQATGRLKNSGRLAEKDVEALSVLSTSLHCELRWAMMGPHVITHPLFKCLHGFDNWWAQKFLIEALSILLLDPDDILFLSRKDSLGGYYVERGVMNYKQDPVAGRLDCAFNTTVSVGEWLSEVALWVFWQHTGECQTLEPCQVLLVNAAALTNSLVLVSDVSALARSYAQEYHKKLTLAVYPLDTPTDLHVPNTEWSELVWCMEPEYRIQISTQAMDLYKRHRGTFRWFSEPELIDPKQVQRKSQQGQGVHGPMFRRSWSTPSVAELEGEIELGQSIVVEQPDGNLERTVCVVMLRIKRPADNRTLYQLGSWQGMRALSNAAWPGAKRQYGEPVDAALHRLLHAEYPFLACVEAEKVSFEVESGPVNRFNLRTVYRNTIVEGFTPEFKLDLPCASMADPFEIREDDTGVASMPVGHQGTSVKLPGWTQDLEIYFHHTGHGLGTFFAYLSPAEAEFVSGNPVAVGVVLQALGRPPHKEQFGSDFENADESEVEVDQTSEIYIEDQPSQSTRMLALARNALEVFGMDV